MRDRDDSSTQMLPGGKPSILPRRYLANSTPLVADLAKKLPLSSVTWDLPKGTIRVGKSTMLPREHWLMLAGNVAGKHGLHISDYLVADMGGYWEISLIQKRLSFFQHVLNFWRKA